VIGTRRYNFNTLTDPERHNAQSYRESVEGRDRDDIMMPMADRSYCVTVRSDKEVFRMKSDTVK